MHLRPLIAIIFLGVGGLAAQSGAPAGAPESTAASQASKPADFTVPPGTKVPLGLINAISTKNSVVGDTVYLETVFPILANGRIVIPVGSYVTGRITEVKRPGRVKGRGELYLRFESLTLPNGVTRDFRGRIGAIDGETQGQLDRSEGAVKSEGKQVGATTVAGTAAAGASIGGMAGAAEGHLGAGLGIGAAAGAAAGIIGVLVSRGPDAALPRGSTVEMVLDRPLLFAGNEVDFGNYQPRPSSSTIPPADAAKKGDPLPLRHLPN